MLNHNPDVLDCLANLSSDEVFTPPKIVNAILDMLPQNIFENPDIKFLDPCCKSGIFLREIAKRLIKGLENKIPDLQERLNYIYSKQLFGIAITELTSFLSRRTVYCSKIANGRYSICKDFKDEQGNIKFKTIKHTWENGKCKYCTIRHTRGDNYERIPEEQTEEFLNHEHVVLTSDSPTVSQVKAWCKIAKECNKEISIRNIEPQNLIQCREELFELANNHLLDIVHCPVQSFDPELLKAMNRNVSATNQAIKVLHELREKEVITATNIIIDYTVDGKLYPNYDRKKLQENFDYYSWNPYFDGNFDMDRAKQRFKKYITKEKVTQK